MEKGLNFRTIESQEKYLSAYGKSLELIAAPITRKYIKTSYGMSHVICTNDTDKPPLVLLHTASCGSAIWYRNIPFLSRHYYVCAVDLIGESSASILTSKLKTPSDNAQWLSETISGLALEKVALCGLSIGGWTAANYASLYPDSVSKLALLSPVQTFAKIYNSYFIKIMKMGFNPTRENIESYIGWGSSKEAPLPDSIIELFMLSVMNMNSNISFPKWTAAQQLARLTMPVLVLFGENEFAFPVEKAVKRARKTIANLELKIVSGASHLLAVSNPDYVNQKLEDFLEK